MNTARATKANQTRDTAPRAREIDVNVDELLRALLALPADRRLSLLDSGGSSTMRAGWAGGRFLIAGFDPFEVIETRGALLRISHRNDTAIHIQHEAALELLDARLREFHHSQGHAQLAHLPLTGACIATFAYDYARRIKLLRTAFSTSPGASLNDDAEPDAVLAFYDSLVIHDYARGTTHVTSNSGACRLEETCETICEGMRAARISRAPRNASRAAPQVLSCVEAKEFSFVSGATGNGDEESASVNSHIATSNFTRGDYIEAVARIKQHIAAGNIYQANLTQQFTVEITDQRFTPEHIFLQLRRDHPAAFAAFIRRADDVCISISPERFLRVTHWANTRRVEAWPIKGTRPRGMTTEEDTCLRRELLTSEKDRAENVMIVDLLRNDLGRVCEYGSIAVTELCALEEHPTLFHLVSKVLGSLRSDVTAGELLSAAFPCGSITGAPKIRAMQIIAETETVRRNLSMGAIGYFSFDGAMDLSVAIRTMTLRDNVARFNVGGGIVADSCPEVEYEESLTKARALLAALDAKISVNGKI